MGDIEYVYVIITPNPHFNIASDANHNHNYWFKLADQDFWNAKHNDCRENNPSFWFGNIRIVRSAHTIQHGWELGPGRAAKVLENRLFHMTDPAPLEGYQQIQGTEWYRTVRNPQMMQFVLNWNLWCGYKGRILEDMNGYLVGDQLVEPHHEGGMTGPSFNSRRALEVYLRRTLRFLPTTPTSKVTSPDLSL